MKSIYLTVDTGFVDRGDLLTLERRLQPEIERIRERYRQGYTSDYASVALPFDKELHRIITQVAHEKRNGKPAAFVVIGIGGSSLGAQAVYYACNGDVRLPIYWADTVDSDGFFTVLKELESLMSAGKTILVNVISKSGGTTETIANFECVLALLKKYYPKNFHEYVVVTTDENSPLWQLAQQEKFTVLAIPEKVGGRYSVFSAVGLFPLAMTGIDIAALCQGAASMVEQCVESSLEKNSAALSAAYLYAWYEKGIKMQDLFLFSPALEGVGKWYRQLMAESLGKESDRNNTVVHHGITPLVSIGSTDLHSMLQLSLAGPVDKATTFVRIATPAHEVKVPVYPAYEKLVPHIQGTSYAQIMDALFDGVTYAYTQYKRPFITVTMPEKKPLYIGQFLQYKMMEIMYVGYLFNINPFNQPQVELYKQKTKALLAADGK